MKVILDTNILVYAAKKKSDLITKIKQQYGPATEILIPNLVINELHKLVQNGKSGADKRAAKLALEIIKFANLKIINLEQGHTDNQIIKFAKKEKVVVGTYDKEFKQKLKKLWIPIFN